jgi:chromosomal replication initiator protein
MSGNYTFQTFIEVECNAMAKKAGMSIIERTAAEYNPLYIWGNHGVGKTHLLYAIQTEAKSKKKSVIYLEGEWFVKDFVNGIRYGTMTRFRDKYRNADILLIDNVEKIIGKKNAQQELFFTIESIISSMGQVVIASSTLPKDLNCSDERLKSYLAMGLVVNISDYSKNESLEIVFSMAKRSGIVLRKELAQDLLDKFNCNMALINEYLTDLAPDEGMISENHITEYVNKKEENGIKEVDIETIIQIVSEFYHIDINLLKSKKKNGPVVRARQLSMYLCSKMTDKSLKVIGDMFNRDHSTVINSINKISDIEKSDAEMRKEIEELSYHINVRIGNRTTK